MSLGEGEVGVVGRLALPRRRFPSPGIPIIIKRGLYSLLRCVPRNAHCNFLLLLIALVPPILQKTVWLHRRLESKLYAPGGKTFSNRT